MDKMSALTMFVATAEQGNFSRAADLLGKTPSALTKAVAQLEEELGTRLFDRTTRRMALTEAGRIYLEGARQALMQLQLATEDVEQLQHELRGDLRITAPPSFAPAFLNQVCCRFLTAYPQVKLEVDLSDNFEDPVDGGYDLALRDGPIDLPGVIAQPLVENQVLLCASPAYLARKGEDVSLENYQQHDWLIFRHPLLNRHFWWVKQGEQRIRLTQPTPRVASDNYDFLLACLLDGQGLQFIPQWSAAPYLARGELVDLMPQYWREPGAFGPWIYVLYLAHRRNTRKVKVFIEYLKAHWQQQQG
ncbi:LysR family transcriptional regulator [Pseudomonas sp. PDM27]|uniref:LysR family transcriptional regulator n=1 Tax=Pseudomonas sp. PDM27 TaxID=2854769 RepID=UPI000C9A0675|nr:LysR family transcriptional regulator [Pseudomonas sp. PDM27]MBV7566139.1 LysR family transcriptional regulator [Pseudomonas sp. PDM27]PNB69758.1 LysR family transcriptional regulator [Pseudomonas sp. GW456-E7]